jgi:hypothetical protein
MLMSAISLSMSPSMCGCVPKPDDPNVIFPGLAFA